MRRFPAISIVLFVSILVMATTLAVDPILFGPSLTKGDVIELEMTTSREQRRGDEQPLEAAVTTPVRLEVLEVADNRTVVSWTTGRSEIENADVLTRLSADPWLELTDGKTREFVFDGEYNYLELRNVEQVIKDVSEGLDTIEAQMPPDGAAFMRQARSMWTDREWVRVMMADRPLRYFLPFGWELIPGVPRREEALLPNPFGVAALDSVVTLELMSFTADDATYTVKWGQRISAKAAKRFSTEVVEKLIGGEPPPEFHELPPPDIRDDAEFEVDRDSGWIRVATVRRTTTLLDMSRIDTYEFRLTKAVLTPPPTETRLVRYEDVGLRPPATGAEIAAAVQKDRPHRRLSGGELPVSSGGTAGHTARGDAIHVMKRGEVIPGTDYGCEARGGSIKPMGGPQGIVVFEQPPERADGICSIGFDVVLAVGSRLNIKKVSWNGVEFEAGVITLQPDGLLWSSQ